MKSISVSSPRDLFRVRFSVHAHEAVVMQQARRYALAVEASEQVADAEQNRLPPHSFHRLRSAL